MEITTNTIISNNINKMKYLNQEIHHKFIFNRDIILLQLSVVYLKIIIFLIWSVALLTYNIIEWILLTQNIY